MARTTRSTAGSKSAAKPASDDVVKTAEEITAEVIGKIQGATDPNDVFSWGTATHAREVLDQPLIVKGFKALSGDFGPYYVVNAEHAETGDDLMVTVGSDVVMAQLDKAEKHGWLPLALKFEEKRTASGNGVLRLIVVS